METNPVLGVRKGAWAKEEDILLRNCIERYGEGKWHLVPLRAGLNRCRKSCRLRWLNYLRPNLKRGYFNKDEVDLIVRLHKLLGNRWSLIAGRLPGRTANDIKNFWNTHFEKKSSPRNSLQKAITESNILRPRPRTFSKLQAAAEQNNEIPKNNNSLSPPGLINDWTKSDENSNKKKPIQENDIDQCIRWWSSLLNTRENGEATPFSFLEIIEPSLSQGLCDHGNNYYNHDGSYP